MSHYARVDKFDIVNTVIVAEQDFIDQLEDKDSWIQTSYNTYGGKHLLGGIPLRKNYAGIGYIYDRIRDAFIPPKPLIGEYDLDEETCLWKEIIKVSINNE